MWARVRVWARPHSDWPGSLTPVTVTCAHGPAPPIESWPLTLGQLLQEQDPFSVQDLVEDGMTEFIPETDQYLRELGLMVEHESLLPQRPVVHTSEFEAIATAEGPPKVLLCFCWACSVAEEALLGMHLRQRSQHAI